MTLTEFFARLAAYFMAHPEINYFVDAMAVVQELTDAEYLDVVLAFEGIHENVSLDRTKVELRDGGVWVPFRSRDQFVASLIENDYDPWFYKALPGYLAPVIWVELSVEQLRRETIDKALSPADARRSQRGKL